MEEQIRTHKDLEIFKRSRQLVKEIYLLTRSLPNSEEFGLISQMRRAALSVPMNIAEGAARKGTKEFVQFLYIALGSLSELDTQLILCNDLDLLFDISLYQNNIVILRKQISSLIKSLNRRIT